jgi:hypothetical protein
MPPLRRVADEVMLEAIRLLDAERPKMLFEGGRLSKASVA